jgi:hypothetical protein
MAKPQSRRYLTSSGIQPEDYCVEMNYDRISATLQGYETVSFEFCLGKLWHERFLIPESD